MTIRLDVDSKAKLSAMARQEHRTVSNLIDIAVKEFLERKGSPETELRAIRLRHADLPDTSVLRAFCEMAPDAFEIARTELNLPKFQFVDDRLEWNRLPVDLFRGESDIVESVNWLPLFWHFNSGGPPPRLDWVSPFLQIFAGHCVFVRKDLLAAHFDDAQLEQFEKFRAESRSGRDLSLRSLIAWVRAYRLPAEAAALDQMWSEAIVGCQTGTDFHIAVRRVAPILRQLSTSKMDDLQIVDPSIPGIRDLEVGFQEFLNGTFSAFTGSLLHSSMLLADGLEDAVLLAGPSDLRITSLNLLALRKGLLDGTRDNDSSGLRTGQAILTLWDKAVRWFTEEVVLSESDELLRKFVELRFPSFLEEQVLRPSDEGLDRLKVLQSLMQTWVRWFPNVDEVEAFPGDGLAEELISSRVTAKDRPTAQDLVQEYQQLSLLLNPSAEMTAPNLHDQKERALWPFPELAIRGNKQSSGVRFPA